MERLGELTPRNSSRQAGPSQQQYRKAGRRASRERASDHNNTHVFRRRRRQKRDSGDDSVKCVAAEAADFLQVPELRWESNAQHVLTFGLGEVPQDMDKPPPT